LAAPLIRLARGDRDFSQLAFIFVIVITYLGYFSYSFMLHEGGGGLGLNMRYCVTILPLLAILCSYSFRELKHWWGPCFGAPMFLVTAALTAGTYYLIVRKLAGATDQLELPLLILPLIFAACIAIPSILSGLGLFPNSRAAGLVSRTMLISAMTWSGMTVFFYDYPFHRYVRSVDMSYSQGLLKNVPEDSVFFTANRSYTVSVMLKTKKRIRIAVPEYDGYKDFTRLLDFHLKAGRRAFGFFPQDLWPRLMSDFLTSHKVSPRALFPDFNFVLAEISRQKE
jgi:hypothetical protein